MANWKCSECGYSKESRCKPRKCPQCGGSKGFEKSLERSGDAKDSCD